MTVIVGAAEGAMAYENSYADASNPTAKMTRMRHTMLADGATQIVLHYAHWTQYESRFITGVKATEPLSIAATVEVIGAGISSASRGTISARQTLTLTVDGTATLTFDLPAPVAKGAYFYSNTYVTAPLAGGQAQIPRGSALSAVRLEGWEVGGTDKTLAGAIPAPADGAQAAYGPVRIDAIVPGEAVRSIGLVGDSIASPRDSFAQQALNAALQPHVGVAVGGEAARTFKLPAENSHRLALIADCDIVLCQLGANDAQASPTIAGVQNTWIPNAVSVWTQLRAGRARPVWQTTTTPQTTSSDGFTSTGGQALTAQSAAITFWNDWLRAGAPLLNGAYAAPGTPGARYAGRSGHPLRGVLEVADHAETARNSGIFRSTGGAWTADGLHFTQLGNGSVGAAVDLAPLLAVATGVITVRFGGADQEVVDVRQGGVSLGTDALRALLGL